jgi:competence protein ComEA
MAGPDLVLHTPFATETFRAGSTIAVSASFHRGQPLDPTRVPRDIVVSLLDSTGREVGTPCSLLDPKNTVTYRDVGALFGGYPVMIYAWPQAPESASGDYTLRVRYRPKQGAQAVVDTSIRIHKKGETPTKFVPADAPGGKYKLAIAEPASGTSFLPGEPIELAIQSAIDSKVAYFYTILNSEEEHDLVLAICAKPGYRMVPDPRDPRKQVYQYEISLTAPFEKSSAVQPFLISSYLVSMMGDGVFESAWTQIGIGEVAVAAASARGVAPAKRGVVRSARSVTPPAAERPEHVVCRIDINSGSRDDLVLLRGIGEKLAERIIAHRPFASVDDLERVPGVGAKLLERLRPVLTT